MIDFGYEWGDPDDQNDRHGDYLAVKKMLLKSISPEKVTLEIGALGGKWTRYLLESKKVIAVDVNNYFEKYLRRKFPRSNNIEFYIGNGDELTGISNKSVDFVFSIDTFMRVRSDYIWSYIKETARVLTDEGGAILHLPNDDLPVSKSRRFIPITTDQINNMAHKYFSEFVIDSCTLLHGSLLIVKKVK